MIARQIDLEKCNATIGKVTYPSISIILLRRSYSEAPGNKGNPKNNSATMQPKDHISMAVVYLMIIKNSKNEHS